MDLRTQWQTAQELTTMMLMEGRVTAHGTSPMLWRQTKRMNIIHMLLDIQELLLVAMVLRIRSPKDPTRASSLIKLLEVKEQEARQTMILMLKMLIGLQMKPTRSAMNPSRARRHDDLRGQRSCGNSWVSTSVTTRPVSRSRLCHILSIHWPRVGLTSISSTVVKQ